MKRNFTHGDWISSVTNNRKKIKEKKEKKIKEKKNKRKKKKIRYT